MPVALTLALLSVKRGAVMFYRTESSPDEAGASLIIVSLYYTFNLSVFLIECFGYWAVFT
jgi:hypothetical protein